MTDVVERLRKALAGHYDIRRELGSGGMATVYLAEDVKHGRKVAVKVLRPELAAILGAERFLKEIEVTANLQHPNILPLYDSGEAESFLYYVMPFVEGESLRDRMNREKQLGVEEAIEIAKSVATALGLAHAHGVIHRDIKPENILFQAGQAVVADFGIALAVSQVGGTRLTETGLSVGTPQYMSPEQATGDRDLDARSDVYSLGAVVYEMLTGDPPHTGNTVQAIVAKILSERPSPIARTRDTVPSNVEAAVLTALAKTPADRFATAAQFADALTNPAFTSSATGGAVAPTQSARGIVRVVWPAATLVALALAVWGWMRPQAAPMVVRTQISLPTDQRLGTSGGGAYPLDVSRDGTRLVYLGEQDGVMRLFLRDIGEFTPRALPGTEGARQPFFSPDGAWVGFFADDQLRRVSVAGGAPISIAELPPGSTGGASWATDGTILFGVGAGLYRVPVVGGETTKLELTVVSPEAESGADSTANMAGNPRWPHHLPDGEHALVTLGQGTGVLTLETGELRYLFPGIQARYLPTGHLIFNAGQERIRTVPFDLDRLEITGPETPALEGVFRGPAGGAAHFAVSQSGTLVYVTGGFERSLWLVDRNGRETPIGVEPRGYRFPRVSPDGNHVAVIVDPRPSDVWIVDLQRVSAEPLTTEGHHVDPSWAPDGERLAFTQEGDVHWMRWREGGEPRRVMSRPFSQYQPSWSPDDRILVNEIAPETGSDLVTLDVTDGTSTPFLVTSANEWAPSFSPNGRWVAYTSDVSGVAEVYVRPFPGPGPRHLISVGGGTEPRWSSDGTELFYRSGDRILAVDARTTPPFAAGQPRELFRADRYDFSQAKNWDVGPDGRFVMVKGDPSALRQFQVVLHWFEELKDR